MTRAKGHSDRAGPAFALRRGRPGDLEALLALEGRLFTTDLLSRRSLRHFLATPRASLIIAAAGDSIAGYALVLFRRGHRVARLYSIGVSRALAGWGIGNALLSAAERQARQRGCAIMRLEVQTGNRRAVGWYRRCGYRLMERREGYYEDGSHALRLEKSLHRERAGMAWRP